MVDPTAPSSDEESSFDDIDQLGGNAAAPEGLIAAPIAAPAAAAQSEMSVDVPILQAEVERLRRSVDEASEQDLEKSACIVKLQGRLKAAEKRNNADAAINFDCVDGVNKSDNKEENEAKNAPFNAYLEEIKSTEEELKQFLETGCFSILLSTLLPLLAYHYSCQLRGYVMGFLLGWNATSLCGAYFFLPDNRATFNRIKIPACIVFLLDLLSLLASTKDQHFLLLSLRIIFLMYRLWSLRAKTAKKFLVMAHQLVPVCDAEKFAANVAAAAAAYEAEQAAAAAAKAAKAAAIAERALRKVELTPIEGKLGLTIAKTPYDNNVFNEYLYISNVAAGSAADQAGLRKGDSIATINGWSYRSKLDALRAIANTEGAVKLEVRYRKELASDEI